ncbi:MAG: hypothetical protein A4E30_00186 [Methanomassiliicoccales archaeon PtaB.Bin215]|nr:MAG: hypothetical protein A4E30_00186 [Methanomassiliicoccales archaeon PtaB.Bin215]
MLSVSARVARENLSQSMSTTTCPPLYWVQARLRNTTVAMKNCSNSITQGRVVPSRRRRMTSTATARVMSMTRALAA